MNATLQTIIALVIVSASAIIFYLLNLILVFAIFDLMAGVLLGVIITTRMMVMTTKKLMADLSTGDLGDLQKLELTAALGKQFGEPPIATMPFSIPADKMPPYTGPTQEEVEESEKEEEQKEEDLNSGEKGDS